MIGKLETLMLFSVKDIYKRSDMFEVEDVSIGDIYMCVY